MITKYLLYKSLRIKIKKHYTEHNFGLTSGVCLGEVQANQFVVS